MFRLGHLSQNKVCTTNKYRFCLNPIISLQLWNSANRQVVKTPLPVSFDLQTGAVECKWIHTQVFYIFFSRTHLRDVDDTVREIFKFRNSYEYIYTEKTHQCCIASDGVPTGPLHHHVAIDPVQRRWRCLPVGVTWGPPHLPFVLILHQ